MLTTTQDMTPDFLWRIERFWVAFRNVSLELSLADHLLQLGLGERMTEEVLGEEEDEL